MKQIKSLISDIGKSTPSGILDPYRIFMALMVAVGVWLLPVLLNGPEASPTKSVESFHIGLAYAGTSRDVCARVCEIQVCTRWVRPEDDPDCKKPGPGGGCCTDYETQCDPDCEPPPPPILPPTITSGLNCSSWGSSSWCVGTLTATLTASDPQGESVMISGDVDGNAFACPSGDTTCSLSLSNEGIGTVNYIVNSATGLSSTGSTNYKLDTASPQSDGSLSGVIGSNGWYVSDVDLSASASDDVSGLASFSMTIDGGASANYADSTFSDGVHTVVMTATDNAGNYTENTQTFSVDTLTPSLDLSLSGTMGSNGWYSSSVQITASASDPSTGSGVDGIEVSKDGGAYIGYTTPITFGDGGHTYQFKATDNAGNVTETSEQEVFVDASGPDISLMEETSLGEILYYEIQDPSTGSGQAGSGLSTIRFVIGDEEERFEKVAWEDSLSGDYYDDGILWDGKFKDGTQAPVGTYYITISATDNAGNESRKTAAVSVTLLSFLQDIPPFDPPPAPLPAPFGGASRGEGQGEGVSPPAMTFGGTVASRSGSTHTKTDFHMPSAANPITASSSENILWGTAAAAAVGAFMADAQRKREEEAARQAERVARLEAKDDHAPLSYKQKAKAYQASLNNYVSGLLAQGFTGEQAARQKKQAMQNGSIPTVASTVAKRERSVALETKMAREDAAEEARWTTMKQKEEEAKALSLAADAARWTGMATLAQQAELAKPRTTIWDTALNWIDSHQTVSSVLVGLGVGVAAVVATIAIVGTAAITLPIIAIAATAAVVTTAVLVGTGTVALNNHYERPANTNVLSNILWGAGTAFLVSGGALVLAAACVTPTGMPLCAAAVPVIDAIEQVSLQVQFAYETATGSPHAGETYIELQLEQNDGGAPGNTAFAEIADIIATHGDEAANLINRHGDQAVKYLQLDIKNVPQGFDNINEYADFGISLRKGLSSAGYDDVQPIFQGSSVTGEKFTTGVPFDMGRVSDYDIALASPSLLEKAKSLGIDLRSGGTRTGPLTNAQLESLDLSDIANELSKMAERPVNFMIYESVDAAVQRTPSILVP